MALNRPNRGGGGSDGGTSTPMTKAQIEQLLFGGLPDGTVPSIVNGRVVDSHVIVDETSGDVNIGGELHSADNVLQLGEHMHLYNAQEGLGVRLSNGNEAMLVMAEFDAYGTSRLYYHKLGEQLFVALNSSSGVRFSDPITVTYTAQDAFLVWEMMVVPLTTGVMHMVIRENDENGQVISQHWTDFKTSDLGTPTAIGIHTPWFSKVGKKYHATFTGVDLDGGVAQHGDRMQGQNVPFMDFVVHPYSKRYLDEDFDGAVNARHLTEVAETLSKNTDCIVDTTKGVMTLTVNTTLVSRMTVRDINSTWGTNALNIVVGTDTLQLTGDNTGNVYELIKDVHKYDVYENGKFKLELEI